MNRRGFALIAVLWFLVALSIVAGATLMSARLGLLASRNRLQLVRAAWAREACVEILQARYRQAGSEASGRQAQASIAVDSVDLGGQAWCRSRVEDPSARLNLNAAERVALATLLGSDSVAAWVIQGRPWFAVEPVCQMLSDSACTRVASLLTVRGAGRINLNAAGSAVLTTLPGVSPRLAEEIILRRARRPIRSVDEVLLIDGGSAPADHYPELVQLAALTPPELVATVEGRVGGGPLIARVTLTLVPLADRLAVVRRETS